MCNDTQHQINEKHSANDNLILDLNWDDEQSLFDFSEPKYSTCGTYHYCMDANRPGSCSRHKWMCKDWKNCPICREIKLKENREILQKLEGKKVLRVNLNDEKLIKSTRTKDQYRRIPCVDSDDVFIILENDDEIKDFETKELTQELIEDLAKYAIDSKRRMSGNLGSKPSSSASGTPQPNLDPIEHREFTLDFSDSDIEEDEWRVLQREMLGEFEFNRNKPRTADFLQYIIWQLEEKFKEVAQRNSVGIHFLKKNISMVDIENVDWKILEKLAKHPLDK